ncbi:MAG TPA: helix-turn-helix transcriptional regulator [Opitutaceae bacterium]|nr:helix-turn-helix transcriptional regulator [Opitutaceae bacterium]
MPTHYLLMRRLIKALRTRQGLTQEGLAEKAGLDYKYYQRFEIGATDAPTVKTLEKLGEVLGVKPWVLLCDDLELIAEKTGIRGLERKVQAKVGRPAKNAP